MCSSYCLHRGIPSALKSRSKSLFKGLCKGISRVLMQSRGSRQMPHTVLYIGGTHHPRRGMRSSKLLVMARHDESPSYNRSRPSRFAALIERKLFSLYVVRGGGSDSWKKRSRNEPEVP